MEKCCIICIWLNCSEELKNIDNGKLNHWYQNIFPNISDHPWFQSLMIRDMINHWLSMIIHDDSLHNTFKDHKNDHCGVKKILLPCPLNWPNRVFEVPTLTSSHDHSWLFSLYSITHPWFLCLWSSMILIFIINYDPTHYVIHDLIFLINCDSQNHDHYVHDPSLG